MLVESCLLFFKVPPQEERGRSEAESPVDIIRTGSWERDYLDHACIQPPLSLVLLFAHFLV